MPRVAPFQRMQGAWRQVCPPLPRVSSRSKWTMRCSVSRGKRRNSESRSTVQGLDFSLNSSKQRRKHFLIYGKHVSPLFAARQPAPSALRLCFIGMQEINRHTHLLEIPVSYRKQRADQILIATRTAPLPTHPEKINRKPTPSPSWRIVTNHSSPITSHSKSQACPTRLYPTP